MTTTYYGRERHEHSVAWTYPMYGVQSIHVAKAIVACAVSHASRLVACSRFILSVRMFRQDFPLEYVEISTSPYVIPGCSS